MKLQLSVSETVAVPWLSFPQKNSFSLFFNCHHSQMSHLNYMWLSEHINEYNSLNLYKHVWIHPILHCFLLSGWMLLVSAAFPLHNPTWGVWLAASGPLAGSSWFPELPNCVVEMRYEITDLMQHLCRLWLSTTKLITWILLFTPIHGVSIWTYKTTHFRHTPVYSIFKTGPRHIQPFSYYSAFLSHFRGNSINIIAL